MRTKIPLLLCPELSGAPAAPQGRTRCTAELGVGSSTAQGHREQSQGLPRRRQPGPQPHSGPPSLLRPQITAPGPHPHSGPPSLLQPHDPQGSRSRESRSSSFWLSMALRCCR